MTFPYVRYEIEPSPTFPSGEIRRPLIPLRIIGPRGAVRILGLLDTGADNVFVSLALANELGIELHENAESALGAGSHELDVWPGSAEIEITWEGQSFRWQAEVGFLAGDDEPPIAYLGHAGFLEHFSATFDTEKWLVDLIPHGGFAQDSGLP